MSLHIDPPEPDPELSDELERAESGPASEPDRRMADLLSEAKEPLSKIRRELQTEGSDESDDLLARINALDYLNTVVGDVGDELPERLGDYRITGLLGRGGMGTVFDAFQESLEREVALKVLAPALTTDLSMRKRFRTEARASASLHHQHIVPVYGFGESGGYLYFTMEKVYGVSLDKHISAARHRKEPVMEPRDLALRFAGVADALDHAHRRGILHRDVKPGNILVHPDGSFALADFGLSKVLGDNSMSMSRTGGFLGTLHYTSPEQAKGGDVSGRSDLYSLGVTMFETLTGELPVKGKTTAAMLQAVLHDTPKRLREVMPKAPKDLDAVLRKLLQKDSEDRYVDGGTLARDLMRVADGEAVRIRRQSMFVLLWRQMRKHPALYASICVASIFLLATLGLWRQQRHEQFDNMLGKALSESEREAGPTFGPNGILGALTGFGFKSDYKTQVTNFLDKARAFSVDDERVQVLREAYGLDPMPGVTRRIRSGHGYEALSDLRFSIDEYAKTGGYTSRDAVTWMLLYRLYVARAVANLTASIANADAAENDLLVATMVRPGAFFPAMLKTFVSWSLRDGKDTDALFAEFDQMQQAPDAPEDAGLAIGSVLLAFAGLERPLDANAMAFGFGFDVRARLFTRGRSLLGARWDEVPSIERSEQEGMVESDLVKVAEEMMRKGGDEAGRALALEQGRMLIGAALADASPLQSWQLVFDLLGAGSMTVFSRDLEIGAKLNGWRDLLLLAPSRVLLKSKEAEFRDLIQTAYGHESQCLAAEAMFEVAVRSTDAYAKCKAWVEADVENPAPYYYRFLSGVLAAPSASSADRVRILSQVGVDAAQALQRAHKVDAGDDMLNRILECLRDASVEAAASEAAGSDAGLGDKWRELRDAFGRG